MYKSDNPSEWTIPSWHPELGDASIELEHLRILANALIEVLHHPISLSLAVPEPGLMYLEINREGKQLAEVYSNCDDKEGRRRYGVFLFPDSKSEQEHYAGSAPEAVALIKEACS